MEKEKVKAIDPVPVSIILGWIAENGVTDRELASAAGISASTVQRMRSGEIRKCDVRLYFFLIAYLKALCGKEVDHE